VQNGRDVQRWRESEYWDWTWRWHAMNCLEPTAYFNHGFAGTVPGTEAKIKIPNPQFIPD
jgi:hypothetical protein